MRCILYRNSIASCLAFLSLTIVSDLFANQQITQVPLPGKNIPKYVEPLPSFVSARIPATPLAPLDVSMEEFQQKVLPATLYTPLLPPYNAGTYVWGYKVGAAPANYPGFTVEAQKGLPVSFLYTNNLIGAAGAPAVLQKYLSVDQTIHWADPLGLMCMMNPNNPECMTPYGYPNWPGVAVANPMPIGAPVPAVAHLHGAEVSSFFDGGPEQWFTPNGIHGPSYATLGPVAGNQALYQYLNAQEATTLWFHDHALGTTRLNVYGGLAAFYLLRDGFDTGVAGTGLNLPAGPQEVEIVIQDRMFDTNGQLLFPDLGINPTVHPFWIPEFFGDTIVVNGKTWPFFNVEPRRYRFRFLNGSNARFYDLAMYDKLLHAGIPIYQIGTDGGLLDSPVPILWPRRLLLAPGERADVIVDFTSSAGKTLFLDNDAKAPFPKGAWPDPLTVGQIMQFRVSTVAAADTSFNPAVAGATLRGGAGQPPAIVRLVNPTIGTLAPGVVVDKKRQLTLVEVMGAGGPLEVLLNNTKWTGEMASMMGMPVAGSTKIGPNWVTEMPRVGSTEVWEIINLTADAHPIHIHLVQFQALNRQPFKTSSYMNDWMAAFPGGMMMPGDGPPLPYNTVNTDGAVGGNIPVASYLQGAPMPPNANEAGWKDTLVMYPGQVTRIAVRWAPQDVAVDGVFAGLNLYPFDPTAGPGYVWHCHILDHEDNEMMRPFAVLP